MYSSNDRRVAGRRQRGFTLLLTLLVLMVGAVAVFLAGRDPAEARVARTLQTSAVDLQHARTALAVYSIANPDRPGSVPCPDFDRNGTADEVYCSSGGDPVYLRRLPWRTIDVASDAELLWYAMDSDFRNDPSAVPINVALDGSLSIDGVGGFAAVIIDPGDPLEGQAGRPSDDVTDYLDVPENTDGDTDFVDCSSEPDCNDRIVGLSVDALFYSVQHRALAAIWRALVEFESMNGHLPYAAPFDSGIVCESGALRGRVPMHDGDCGSGQSLSTSLFSVPTVDAAWIVENDWLDHVVYAVDGDCTAAGGGCTAPTLTLESEAGLAVVLAAAGTEIAALGQDRGDIASLTVADFLESSENTDGDESFDDRMLAEGEDNDVLSGFVSP